jgi:hypothetical protein
LFIFTLLIFIGSIGWLVFEPGWEPALFALSSFSAVILTGKSFIKEQYKKFTAYKIPVSDGAIALDDDALLKILRPLCLGEKVGVEVINLQVNALEKHARKKVKDENKQYYLLSQVDRSKKKLELADAGIKQITTLYRKGFINCAIEKLPLIVRRYVSVIYPPIPGSPLFLEKQGEKAFDIYSNCVVKHEISFIADLPEKAVHAIIEKLELKSTQEMCLPYMYSALQLPEDILYEYVVTAQVFAGLTRYKNEIENNNFWALHNWAVGPH